LTPFYSILNHSSISLQNLRSLVADHNLPKSPRALLVVSAHHVEKEHTVVMAEKPGLLYDYYGFPDVAYKVVIVTFGGFVSKWDFYSSTGNNS
jgi:aromatic ring-opening dioxygenase catalytic subunit (LigB family)